MENSKLSRLPGGVIGHRISIFGSRLLLIGGRTGIFSYNKSIYQFDFGKFRVTQFLPP